MAKKLVRFRFGPKLFVITIAFICCFAMGTYFLAISVSKDSAGVSVNSKTNVDYKVHLKKNSYYENSVLDSNLKYIASLINYIDTNIDYSITASDKMNYDYSYYIDATTRVYGDNSKSNVIFEKTSTLVDEKKIKETDKNDINIKENLKINYNEYNALIAAFKTSFDLSSVSDLTVALHVKVNAKNNEIEKSMNIDDTSKIVIPLTEQTIGIDITTSPANSYKLLKSDENILLRNYKYLIPSVIFYIISIILFYFMLKKVGLLKVSEVSKYKKQLKKILKEYDLIIANVDHHIDEDQYEVIKVETFGELKDVHDNVGNPILFKETIKNRNSEFIIVKDEFLYKYTLSIGRENRHYD